MQQKPRPESVLTYDTFHGLLAARWSAAIARERSLIAEFCECAISGKQAQPEIGTA